MSSTTTSAAYIGGIYAGALWGIPGAIVGMIVGGLLGWWVGRRSP